MSSRSPKDDFEAFRYAETPSPLPFRLVIPPKVAGAAIRWGLPLIFAAGSVASIPVSMHFAGKAYEGLMPDKGIQAILEECEKHYFDLDVSIPQRAVNRDDCVEVKFGPARDSYNKIRRAGDGAAVFFGLGFVFSAAAGFAFGRREKRLAAEAAARARLFNPETY